EIEDPHDVLVHDAIRRASLADEAFALPCIASEVRLQHLDRHFGIERHVMGGVHRGHPAFAESLEDAVASGERRTDEVLWTQPVGHPRAAYTRTCRSAGAGWLRRN